MNMFRSLYQANLGLDPILLIGLGIILLLVLTMGFILGQVFARRGKAGVFKARAAGPNGSANPERLENFFKLAETLSSTLSYDRVLDIALDMSLDTFSDNGGPNQELVCAVLLFDADELIVETARGFTSADVRMTMPGLNGGLGNTLSRGESTIVRHPTNDPELSRLVAVRNCNAAYCLPLRSGLDVYGVLLYAHPDIDFFNGDRRDMLDLLANQAMKALQNARLYQDLEAEKERMTEIQEDARRKLARDLHDGPTQSVAAIAMRVNFARRLMERNPEQAAEELYKIEDLARRTTKEIRHMLFTLRPLVLETKGLTAALEAMALKMRETFEQNVILDVEDNVVLQMDISRQGVVFYICEEAVTNARKHARANHVWVRLRTARNEIALLEIRDDGVGFDVQTTESTYENRGSLGMINLRERAELINSVFQLKSQQGVGTRIRVWIPLTEEAAEKMWQRT
jgi:signal transduction histidine kinase